MGLRLEGRVINIHYLIPSGSHNLRAQLWDRQAGRAGRDRPRLANSRRDWLPPRARAELSNSAWILGRWLLVMRTRELRVTCRDAVVPRFGWRPVAGTR